MVNVFRDEHGRNLSELSRVFGAKYKLGGEHSERKLAGTAVRIASAHGIKNVPAHQTLLRELFILPIVIRSGASLEPGAWSIPRDLTEWKKVRPKLETLSKRLTSISDSLDDLIDDPVAMAALSRFDHMQRLPDLVEAVCALSEIAWSASKIAGRKGNRPIPPWTSKAAGLCQEFWREHKFDEPKPYFNLVAKPKKNERVTNSTTEPANAFSRWFCAVMRAVAGFTPSQCDTILRH